MSWGPWWGWPGCLAPEQINQLPPAASVSPADLFAVDQSNGNGTSTTRAATAQQIINVLIPPYGFVTMTQLKLALVAQSQFTACNNAALLLSASNPVSIRWLTGSYTQLGDAVSAFVQSTTSYTNNQMILLYQLATTEQA